MSVTIAKLKGKIAKAQGRLEKVHAKYAVARRHHKRLKMAYYKARAQRLQAHIANMKKRLAELEAQSQPTQMFDSVTTAAIPADAKAAAGYVDGRYKNFAQVVARTPHARHVSIAVFASDDADALDIETGDAVPAQAPDWVKRQHARGKARPIVYSSQSEMPQVLSALDRAGIKRSQVRVWSAHYGFKHICSPEACRAAFTADATQFTTNALGRNLDESVCRPSFW